MKVTPGKIAGVIRRLDKRHRDALERGAKRGAVMGLKILRDVTPVDQGQLKVAWRLASSLETRLPIIMNDAPHAGIVENGARPHPVNAAGMQALFEWAMHHRQEFGILTKGGKIARGKNAEKEAWSIAWAIATKIKLEGQKPTYFIKNAMPAVTKAVLFEIFTQMSNVSEKGDG